MMPMVLDAARGTAAGVPYDVATAWGPAYPAAAFDGTAKDKPADLARWQPEVRLAVVGWDLREGLVVTAGGRQATLSVQGKAAVALTSPNLGVLQEQAGIVLSQQMRFRGEDDFDVHQLRQAEILMQVTPPMAFWSALLPLHPDRTPSTYELMQAVLGFASDVVLRVKQAIACPRPYEMHPDILPMVLTPGHGSFPSGHATEATAVSIVLAHLLSADPAAEHPQHRNPLRELAWRIARNRVIAGLHFPIDSTAGHLLGEFLAKYVVGCAIGRDAETGSFDASTAVAAGIRSTDPLSPASQQPECQATGALAVAVRPNVQWLWSKARTEWGY
ncbi:phosphatase PAP2 family protein [Albitalea terrae]|uniref:Phosphatase PAP2 family protein n=2 Tax=Piscinibacter terrae TaxID=2496871 RepID=A0A3N7HH29_9BURK|nr:phosphatase PAP2 family protein [Albitalea terrae]